MQPNIFNHFVLSMRNFLLFLLGVFLLVSCKSDKKTKPDTTVPPKYVVSSEPEFKHQGNLKFFNETDEIGEIQVEIADTPAKREKGLMYRKLMNEDKGMLFVFPDEKRRSFWMKNTHLHLDIIFVNANKEIVNIAENCQPYSTDRIPSFEYAMYVVEVMAGYCNRNGIKVGDYIEYQISN